MKKKFYKYLFLILAVLPLLLFVFPLWVIDMDAPQFPEGLEMNIHINTIKGTEEHGLASINGLNHYIGMKKIEPDSIKELKYMPWILVVMTLFGVAVSLVGKKNLIVIWLIIYSLLGIAGMYDFYIWETDYGHNLDPHAIIKAGDMSYQPPLIGTKEIMNFHVTSLPGTGGYILFGCLIAGWVIIIFGKRIFIKTSKDEV